MNKHKYTNILPITTYGKVSAILYFSWLLVGQITLAKAQSSNIDKYRSLLDDTTLTYLLVALGVIGLGAIVSGVIAIWKMRERSSFVIVPTSFGLLMAFIVLIAVVTA
jgi:hypothetical protein